MKRLLLPLASLCLAACGPADTPAPAAVSSDEARALDEAGEMIEGIDASASSVAADSAP